MTILEPQAVPDAPGPRLLTPGPASGPAPGSASSQGSGPRLAPDVTEPSSLWVVPLPDPLVEAFGFDPRSWYVERFWLPVIGPTCTWLLRHVAAGLEAAAVQAADDQAAPGVAGPTADATEERAPGFSLQIEDTALALGVGGRRGRHSPFGRALSRCVAFDLARFQSRDTLSVRRMLPPLARRHLLRLPPALQEEHHRWTAARHEEPTIDQQRRRARRLALGLVALGDAFDRAEGQLLRWGVHPALTDETVRWARALREA